MLIGFHREAGRIQAVDNIGNFGQSALDVGKWERRPEAEPFGLPLDEAAGEVVALPRQVSVECPVVRGERDTR